MWSRTPDRAEPDYAKLIGFALIASLLTVPALLTLIPKADAAPSQPTAPASQPVVLQSSPVSMTTKKGLPTGGVTQSMSETATFGLYGSASFTTGSISFTINSTNTNDASWSLLSNSSLIDQRYSKNGITLDMDWKVKADYSGFKLLITYSCPTPKVLVFKMGFDSSKYSDQLVSSYRWAVNTIGSNFSKGYFAFDFSDAVANFAGFDMAGRNLKFNCSGSGVIDPNTVTTGADYTVLFPDGKAYKSSNGCYYVVVNNANLQVFSSTDQSTWTSRTTLTNPGAAYISGTSIWFTSTDASNIFREKATLNGDCTISGGAGKTYNAGANQVVQTALMQVTASGSQSYLMYVKSGSVWHEVTNTASDFSGTDTDNALNSLGTLTLQVSLIPISSGKAYAEYFDTDVGPAKGRTLNADGTMGAIETISSTNEAQNPESGGCIDVTSTITCVYKTAAGTVKGNQKSDSAGSWGTEFTVAALGGISVGACVVTDGTYAFAYILNNPASTRWHIYRYSISTSGVVGSQANVTSIFSTEHNIYDGGTGAAFPFSCEMQTIASGGAATLAWMEGTANPYNVVEASDTLPVFVTVTGKCTTSPAGATQDTVSLSGGSISPTTMACDGATHSLTATSGATLTATVGSAGANQLYRFNPSGTLTTSLTFTAAAANWFFHDYLTDTVTASYSGTVSTAPVLHFTQGGNATTYPLTTSGTSKQIDHGTAWTITKSGNFPSATERYQTSFANSTASAGQTINPAFYHQFAQTASYSGTVAPSGAPSLRCIQFGSAAPNLLSTSPATVWCDSGGAYTITKPAADFASSGERYDTGLANGTASAAATIAPVFYHQYLITNPGSLSVVRTSFGTVQAAVAGNAFGDAKASVTVNGQYPGSFNLPFPVYIYQEPSQGFQMWSNTTLSSIAFASSPSRTTWTSTKANVTLFESPAIQAALGTPSVAYLNGVAALITPSGANVWDIKGSGSFEVDFSGTGGSSNGGPSTGGGGGGGAVFTTSTTTQTVQSTQAPLTQDQQSNLSLGAILIASSVIGIIGWQYFQSVRDPAKGLNALFGKDMKMKNLKKWFRRWV